MTTEEQEQIKQKAYKEAMRYIANAENDLKKAGKDGKHYKDPKYIRRASGTAYNGTLLALDAWLELKGVRQPKGDSRKSIKFYTTEINKLDRKLAGDLKKVYDALHLSGYYDGTLLAGTINDGFEQAVSIINRIKPQEAL